VLRRLALVGLIIALASYACASASAQSAGDQEYFDPTDEITQPQSGEPGDGSDRSQGGSRSGGGSSAAAAPSSPAGASASANASPSASGAELPRSGLPTAVLAGIGAALLAGGVALRRLA
jgi:hypothetical protein